MIFIVTSTTRNIQVQVTTNQAYVYHANPDSTITVWNDIGTGLYSHNGWYRTDFKIRRDKKWQRVT